jgi:hypothetical protein
MKAALLVLCLFLASPRIATAAETWQDAFLSSDVGYADSTLGDIYLALPQQLFEITYRQRIEFLIRGSIRFDPDKKQIVVPGDGGQARITARVVTQTKDKLVLDVLTELESAKIHYTLERTPHGWTATERH